MKKKRNWQRWPNDIRVSFINATHKMRITKTNKRHPSNHILWKEAVSTEKLDFDWGIWLVLRTIYHDSIDQDERQLFKNGGTSTKIAERYYDTDVLTASTPTNFRPRPAKWARVADCPSATPLVSQPTVLVGNQVSFEQYKAQHKDIPATTHNQNGSNVSPNSFTRRYSAASQTHHRPQYPSFEGGSERSIHTQSVQTSGSNEAGKEWMPSHQYINPSEPTLRIHRSKPGINPSTVAEQSNTQALGSRTALLTGIEAGGDINAMVGKAAADIAKKNIEPWMANRFDTITQELKTTVANHFRWSITSEAEKFLHRRLPELNAEIEPFAERIMSKLQPEITQQIDSALATFTNEITQQIDSAMATFKNEMMECSNDFKASLGPWIAQQIETAIVNRENRLKAEEAALKRSYEAYLQDHRNN
ncbi:hypothetical protein ACHAPO_001425 [Fusarium lateritium]